MKLDSKIPPGPLAEKWTKHTAAIKLVNPANKRKLKVIVIGTGLAGASAAASLGELGYKVKPDYLFVIFLAWTKLFQLHDACFIPYLPGNDLSGVFAVIGLDDRPTAVMAVMAAPFEVMQVACHVDLLDEGITIAGFMGGLN